MIQFLLGLVVLLVASLGLKPVRDLVRPHVPYYWIVHLKALRQGVRAEYDVRIAMPDGVHLAASLYRPRKHADKLATVLIRTPYNRLAHTDAPDMALFFASHGYAVLIEDVRGKYGSEGEFVPYRSGTRDGVATLDWIVAQPWSNGKVGTFGCSALGELQFVLARARHPAHKAMIAIGAGGAMGSAAGRYSYFGQYEGGIWQLASGLGWFSVHGAKELKVAQPEPADYQATLRTLPTAGIMRTVTSAPNNYDDYVRTGLTDAWWKSLDFISDDDVLNTPAMVINTWGDQTLGDTFALDAFVRRTVDSTAARQQHVIIGPGNHCEHEAVGSTGQFGELEVSGAGQPYREWYLRWFDHWLRDHGDALNDLPAYRYYMVGENRWLSAAQWPPQEARPQRWYLSSQGHANTRHGDGVLTAEPPTAQGVDEYTYDPMNPVPSVGGPVCCTGDPRQKSGPVEQRVVEERADVLVYTSAVLDADLRIAGPLHAVLKVSSSARDTDFIARLVDVWPDGRALNIQEGALRARYRAGIDKPALLEPGRMEEVSIDMRSIAWSLPKGHRLRLQVTSSSFPRLERNLNTGGRNSEESAGVVAVNRLHHGAAALSFVELAVLPASS